MDLINKQVIYDKIVKRYPDRDTDQYAVGYADAINDVLRDIRYEPSAESEIIRCSQCRFAEVADKEDEQDGYTCQFHRGSIWFSGSYCSWAERRTDEAD